MKNLPLVTQIAINYLFKSYFLRKFREFKHIVTLKTYSKSNKTIYARQTQLVSTG